MCNANTINIYIQIYISIYISGYDSLKLKHKLGTDQSPNKYQKIVKL